MAGSNDFWNINSKLRRAWTKLAGGGSAPRTERAKRAMYESCAECLSPINEAMVTATVSTKDMETYTRDRSMKELERISLFQIDGELGPLLLEEERARESMFKFMEDEGVSFQFEGGGVDRMWHFYLIGLVSFFDFAGAYLFIAQYAESAATALGGAAITVAATVGLSAAAVAAGRQWLRPNRRAKAVAVVLAPLAAACGLFVHLVMGHGRDDLITGEVSRMAILSRVAEAPFDLSGEGLGFVFMGGLAFGLCCWEWLRSDSAYPGYGRKWRRVDNAEHARESKLEEIRGSIYEAIEGVHARACLTVHKTQVMAARTLQEVEHVFIRLGTTDPGALDRDLETDPGRIHLIDGWNNSQALIAACKAVGDLEFRLARRPDEMDQEKPPPVEVENLVECVRVEEARLWLDRYVDNFSAEHHVEDSKNEESER